MAPQEERKGKKGEPVTDMLPELLAMALAGDKDFILCHETDEETNIQTIHVMTGRFITPCMLRKLIGQAESQKDEGATLLSKPVKSARKKGKRPISAESRLPARPSPFPRTSLPGHFHLLPSHD